VKLLVLMGHSSPWANEIAASLKRLGHEIHVLDFDTLAFGGMPTDAADTEERLHAYDSTTLVRRPRAALAQHFALVLPLRRLARRLKPDATLCLYAGRFAFASYLAGVRPYIVYVVGSDVLLANAVQRRINRAVLTPASLVLANGKHLADATRQQAPAAKVESLLMGVDVDQWRPQPRHTIPRIFNHRLFTDVYNNNAIIRALAKLPPDTPRFQMIFASGGTQLEESIRLADRMLPPTIRGCVEFWRGNMRREEIRAALAETDIYVSMARSDGTATSVLEAMACGAFPILSDIPANRPFVQPGRGALVDADDDAALARRLEHALRNVAECRALADSIREYIRRTADASVNMALLSERLQWAAAQ
jgi:glycosyltransferase involved in cell wall biosynthesis